LIASLYGYSRADVDRFAVQSQTRAAQAWEEKRFARSVAPVYAVDGVALLDHDEHRRPGTSVESLAKLPASRSEEHTSELQSLMRISYAVFCLKKKTNHQ